MKLFYYLKFPLYFEFLHLLISIQFSYVFHIQLKIWNRINFYMSQNLDE